MLLHDHINLASYYASNFYKRVILSKTGNLNVMSKCVHSLYCIDRMKLHQ